MHDGNLHKESCRRLESRCSAQGLSHVLKTWRTKRDAQHWATSVEDETRCGAFIRRESAERTTMSDALDRDLAEVVPTKRKSTQRGNRSQAERLRGYFGDYGLSAVTPELSWPPIGINGA